jgi:hypothetical protein
MGYLLKKRRFTHIVITTGSLALAWTAPVKMADNTAIGTITDYVIYYSTTPIMGTDAAYSNSQSVGSAALSYTLTGLISGQIYYVAVAAVVGGVTGNPSAEFTGSAA